MVQPNIVFYLPRKAWPYAVLPESVESDTSIYFLGTHLNWVLQTYLRLKSAGYPIVLSPELPTEGIVVTFNGLLPLDFVPNPRQYLVSISADNSPHMYAQLHVVQNRTQTKMLADSFHIPHWPQAGLIPRDAGRGIRFERAVFFGDSLNLAEELRGPEWRRSLAETGIDWTVRDQQSAKNMDYSDVDVVVAVRSFQRRGFIRKPASKLYNAWIAGVPALLGVEFAFREERRSELDFIEVTSCQAAISAIRRLKASPELPARMVENGFQRAQDVGVEKLTEKWWRLLSDVAMPKFEAWQKIADSRRKHFIFKRSLEKKIRGLRHKVLQVLGREQNSL
jgi:hypothetical protein